MFDLENEILLFTKSLKQKSSNTIYNYSITIRQFFNWIVENGYEFIIEDEDVEKEQLQAIVEEYKDELFSSNNYEIKTINCKCDGLNAYFKYKDLNCHIYREKVQSQTFINDMLTNEELKEIANCAKENNDFRTYAIIHSFFYTGARISELLQLKVRDLNKNEVMIKGKGGKYRKLFIPNKLKDILIEYNEYHRRDTSPTALFTGERGALTKSTVNKNFNKYFDILGYDEDKKLTPHVIRHIFTKNLMSKSVSISAIKQLLGHSLTTTDIYGQLSKKELMDILESLDF